MVFWLGVQRGQFVKSSFPSFELLSLSQMMVMRVGGVSCVASSFTGALCVG
jgi:hypothetical protein